MLVHVSTGQGPFYRIFGATAISVPSFPVWRPPVLRSSGPPGPGRGHQARGAPGAAERGAGAGAQARAREEAEAEKGGGGGLR